MRRELIRKLLGSPAMVWELDGLEKSVAVRGYVDAKMIHREGTSC